MIEFLQKFLAAQNCTKKDLNFFDYESNRYFEVNFLVLREYRAIFDIKKYITNTYTRELPSKSL